MTDDHERLELKLAKAAYAEAEQIKKAAERDRAAAEYDRGQIEHAKRTMEQMELSIAARERKLKELGEDTLLAREKAADDKLTQAQELMRAYDRDRHAAMISLQHIDAREKAEREAA